MANRDYIYDIETYPNVFTLTIEHCVNAQRVVFEISPWRNDSAAIIGYLRELKNTNSRMVGFNNLGFDYPIIHKLINMGSSDARTLYDFGQSIINSQNSDNRWRYQVRVSDRHVEQIDLFKIHHFDNRARSASLKMIEFNMRSDNIKDLPFPVGQELNQHQIDTLKQYNAHDVEQTKLFYHKSFAMIEFREQLSAKYKKDFLNHSDIKIGKDYFIMKLEQHGVQCYEFGVNGRKPRQTPRANLALKDCIFPWINFTNPRFTKVLEFLKSQTITETKNVFKGLVATVDGFDFHFGLGGIHGSIESSAISGDDDYTIQDWDVESYYPSIAIANNLKPEHLSDDFCKIYADLKKQRTSIDKSNPVNKMLKLALNGVFGDSNSKFSVFYDPKFTMSITLNGQLLLCMLAERLMSIESLSLIQINTDGLTVRFKKTVQSQVDNVCHYWEHQTLLKMEQKMYHCMFIRDVNNYIAVIEQPSPRLLQNIKRKGAYEFERQWYQNTSAMVVPKAAQMVLVYGFKIRDAVINNDGIMDFMLLAKVPRKSKLCSTDADGADTILQNTCRYYVAKDGERLFKLMPPTPKMLQEGKTEYRRIGINTSYLVQECNDMPDERSIRLNIDYDFYINEVEKLILGIT